MCAKAPTPPSALARAAGRCAIAVAAVALAGPSSAAAVQAPRVAIVPGAGGGSTAQGVPRRDAIRFTTTALDTRTGRWRTTIHFRAPQPRIRINELSFALTFYGDDGPYSRAPGPTPTIVVPTGPADPQPRYEQDTDPASSTGAPTIEVSSIVPDARYNRARTALTVSVEDPALAGRPRPQDVSGSVHPPGRPLAVSSSFRAPMGIHAPRASIDRRNDAIATSATGRFTLHLHPLTAPAVQYLNVFSPGGQTIASNVLPASAYRRRTVAIRIDRPLLHRFHLHGKAHPAILRIGTSQTYGRDTFTVRHITIQRP